MRWALPVRLARKVRSGLWVRWVPLVRTVLTVPRVRWAQWVRRVLLARWVRRGLLVSTEPTALMVRLGLRVRRVISVRLARWDLKGPLA